LEKGYFRNRQEFVREIPMAYIESMNRTGNKLSIIWKGVMETFIVEEGDLTGTVFEMMPQISLEQRIIFEDKEMTKKKWNKLISMLSMAMETIDSLFDILRSLHGWVDWDRVEGFLKSSQENAVRLTDQKIELSGIDFSKLSSTIKERLSEETSKETYNLLKLLYDYFGGLDSANESLKETHPNYYDAKTAIQAHYLLNDIMLGTILEDAEIGKEHNELLITLEDLAREAGIRIDINAIKNVIAKLDAEKVQENVIKKNRSVFRQQLKDLITPVPT
jgi:hypothetical protein